MAFVYLLFYVDVSERRKPLAVTHIVTFHTRATSIHFSYSVAVVYQFNGDISKNYPRDRRVPFATREYMYLACALLGTWSWLLLPQRNNIYQPKSCTRFVLYCSVVFYGRFYTYHWGIFLWHQGNTLLTLNTVVNANCQNSMRQCDAYMFRCTGPSLVQIIHYMKQSWGFVYWTLGNNFQKMWIKTKFSFKTMALKCFL